MMDLGTTFTAALTYRFVSSQILFSLIYITFILTSETPLSFTLSLSPGPRHERLPSAYILLTLSVATLARVVCRFHVNIKT